MKVLSIGNSFSHDAHKWLNPLARTLGFDIYTANLYIGGCSLETHWNNFVGDRADYDFEINGGEGEGKIAISEALLKDKWDVVTLQQASGFSGMFDTYQPYLSNLAREVRKACPSAKLCFHETWAYEHDAAHPHFVNYSNSQSEMIERIREASRLACDTIGAKLIASGDTIQTLRENACEFDFQGGGLSLCRDGYHLSLDFGRFAAAATWIATLTDKKLTPVSFEDFDADIIAKIVDTVNAVVFSD